MPVWISEIAAAVKPAIWMRRRLGPESDPREADRDTDQGEAGERVDAEGLEHRGVLMGPVVGLQRCARGAWLGTVGGGHEPGDPGGRRT